MALKNLDMWDVFPQKPGNAHVYPHENTNMARERGCVSSSHHHRAWKRVCVKDAFPHLYTWVLKNLDIRDVFSPKHGKARGACVSS